MSRPYGPIPLTAGIVTHQDIDMSGDWVVIENSSLSLDLGVSFQVNPPPVVSVFSGRPYDGVIQSGGWRKFRLPADTMWRGRIWLFPLSVASQSAATGTTSSYSRAYITAYESGEEVADAATIIRALDLVSQPRVVDVPVGNQQWQTVTGTLPSLGDSTGLAQDISLSAVNIVNGHIEAYLSALFFQLGEPAQGGAGLTIDWVIKDNASVVLSSIPILEFACYSPGVNTGPGTIIDRTWPIPLNWDVDLPVNAAFVGLRLTTVAITAVGVANAPFNFHASWWLDLSNRIPVAATGNAVLHQAPGASF